MNDFTQIETQYPGRLARVIQSGGRAALAALQQLVASWKRRRLARQAILALYKLDAWTLRDLGLDRSEILLVAAEVSGGAELTGARVATLYRSPF